MMVRCKVVVGANHCVQITLHQLKDDVNVLVGSRIRGEHNVLDFNHVRVLEKPQELDFTKDSGSISDMLKYVLNALDGNALTREVVDGCADDAVGAFADNLLNCISPRLYHSAISSGKEGGGKLCWRLR